ncbi:hypothetical protein PQQ63_15380 [Paraburkholderia metrosideri]|uniref:Uncharacterized protein n=1 Tax=Paraburkholderia metrosideri TaxID=580937 RepID=A0ABW9DRU6_9BURK
MPIDPSIPLGAQAPTPINPLQTMATVQAYQGNALRNQVMGAQLQSNQAQSQAVLQATDPTTGQTDWGKAQSILAQDPQNAYNAPAFAQQVQQMKTGQVALDTNAQALAAKRMGVIAQIGVANLSNPNATPQDYVNGIVSAAQNGQIDPQSASTAIVHASQVLSDPQQFKTYLQNGLAALPPEIQAQYVKPAIQAINTGGQTNIVATNPISGAPTVTGSLTNTLSPSEQVARVPTVGANGAQGTVSQASLAPPSLLPPGTAPGAMSEGGNGRYPTAAPAAGAVPAAGASTPGAAPAPASTPAAAAGPAGFLPTSLPPGVSQAADVAGTASGQQFADDQKANAGSGQRVYQLQSALTGLQNAGSTGPGTATMNNIKSFLLAQSPDWLKNHLPGVDPNQIQNYDEANKYLTQYADAKAASMGGDTAKQLATTLSGNASTHISNLAAQDVVKANIGLERMGQAQQAAFAASGLPTSQYTTFASKFGSTIDPRVFIADQLPPTQVMNIVSKMKPQEQAQFKNQYNWAVQNGYISGPQ